MVKAVIFDWGGVISEERNGGWFNYLTNILGVSVDELRPHWLVAYPELRLGHIDEKTFWQRFKDSYGKPLPPETYSVWEMGSNVEPWPVMVEFTAKLRAQGLKTAILSNTVKPMADLVHASGNYTGFNPVILSDEVGLAKPDPAIYELMLKKLGLSARECIYVDDLEHNLPPAQSLGMKIIFASKEPKETIRLVESKLK